MSPQRHTHWQIFFDIARQLSAKYPAKRLPRTYGSIFPGA